MAEEKMVGPSGEFVSAVKDVVARIDDAEGPLYYAGVHRLEEQDPVDWVLLIGSVRLARDPYDGGGRVARQLNKHLSKQHRSLIAKIGILQPDDPFFREMARGMRVRLGSDAYIENCRVNRVDIVEAHVFVADSKATQAKSGTGGRKSGPRRPPARRTHPTKSR